MLLYRVPDLPEELVKIEIACYSGLLNILLGNMTASMYNYVRTFLGQILRVISWWLPLWNVQLE